MYFPCKGKGCFRVGNKLLLKIRKKVSVFISIFGSLNLVTHPSVHLFFKDKHWLVKDVYSIKLHIFYSFLFQEFQNIYLNDENLMTEANYKESNIFRESEIGLKNSSQWRNYRWFKNLCWRSVVKKLIVYVSTNSLNVHKHPHNEIGISAWGSFFSFD